MDNITGEQMHTVRLQVSQIGGHFDPLNPSGQALQRAGKNLTKPKERQFETPWNSPQIKPACSCEIARKQRSRQLKMPK